MLWYFLVTRPREKAAKMERVMKVVAEQKRERKREREVHEYFQNEFEKRKQAIGQIVCPQCQWTGTWGEGMSYQEFFAYDLHKKYEVKIDELLVREADNLNLESQFKCPMCKSTNWQKV